MRRVYLSEIEINYLLGCEHLHLVFNAQYPVTVLQLAPNCEHLHSPVITAIELICSTKYATISSLENIPNIGVGHVRIVFLTPKSYVRQAVNGDSGIDIGTFETDYDSDDDNTPCTSTQALARQERRRLRMECKYNQLVKVEAYRTFHDNIDKITYSINNAVVPTISTIYQFYDNFFESVEFIMPGLKQLQGFCNGNWLNLMQIVADSNFYEGDGNPFDLLTKIFMENPLRSTDFLSILTKELLKTKDMVNNVRRIYLLKIFNHVRKIFEFITCLEYTLYFFVPCQNRYVNVQHITLDDFNFNDVKIKITLMSNTSSDEYLWNEANHSIQDLVYISFQFALAFNCNQPIVFVDNLNMLRDYQCLRMASAAYLQKVVKDTDIDWTCHNYLQRIIDVAIKLKILVIIEYPGGTPQPLTNANVVKCEFHNDKWLINLRDEQANNRNTITNPVEVFEAEMQNLI